MCPAWQAFGLLPPRAISGPSRERVKFVRETAPNRDKVGTILLRGCQLIRGDKHRSSRRPAGDQSRRHTLVVRSTPNTVGKAHSPDLRVREAWKSKLRRGWPQNSWKLDAFCVTFTSGPTSHTIAGKVTGATPVACCWLLAQHPHRPVL
jgi:hypothetical protein